MDKWHEKCDKCGRAYGYRTIERCLLDAMAAGAHTVPEMEVATGLGGQRIGHRLSKMAEGGLIRHNREKDIVRPWRGGSRFKWWEAKEGRKDV